MEKINKLLEENALMRRIVLGLAFAAICLCFVLCIVCLFRLERSISWLFGTIVCGMLAGAFGGILFHLTMLEEES